MFMMNQRVRFDVTLDGSNEQGGVIAGGPTLLRGHNLCWPISLDDGFFSADGKTYISVMLVNGEGIKAASDVVPVTE